MATGRLLSVAFGPAIAVAMAVPAWAQTTRGVQPGQPGADSPNTRGSTNNQDQNRPPNPFNDPAMQLRRLRDQVATFQVQGNDNNRGGRGGRGGFGGFGGGGGIQSVLMRNSALQDAIEMTPEQKKAIETINEKSSQQRRELFQSMRNNNQGNNGGGRGGPGGGRGGPGGGFDPAMMQQMQQMMQAQSQQQQSALSKVLSKKQHSRLNQIRLQILGPLGVAETDVAQSLLLTTDQYAQIQQIMQALEAQRDAMRQAAFAQMRPGGPGGPGGAPGGRGAPGAAPGAPGAPGGNQAVQTQGTRTAQDQGNQANNDNNNNNGGRRRGGFDPNSPEFKAMQERMKKMADDDAALEKKAITAIGKILTPKQRSLFNKMLGEPYDLAKLVENQGRGGRGGPGGPGGGAPRGGAPTQSGTAPGGRSTQTTNSTTR